MQFNLSRTHDLGLVRSIITHPMIYGRMTDDSSASASEFRPPEHPAIIYLLVTSSVGEALGLFMLVPANAACIEVHTCLLPSAWGKLSREIGRAGMRWVFENTSFNRIITNVPEFNRIAERFAVDCGMTRYGVNPKSFLRGGMLYDQIMLGVSKGER